MPDYLLKQRQGWYAVLEIPKDLRKHFVKSRFKETLGTQSRSEAKIRVLGVVQGWKQQIAICPARARSFCKKLMHYRYSKVIGGADKCSHHKK